MSIEVNINTVLLGFLIVLAIALLVYCIITLIKINKLIKNSNDIIENNRANIDNTLKNINDISEDIKELSGVAIETTADVLVLKEGLFDKVEIVKDIINIFLSVVLNK